MKGLARESRRSMPVGDETHGRKCSNLLLVSLLISVSAGIDRLFQLCFTEEDEEEESKSIERERETNKKKSCLCL